MLKANVVCTHRGIPSRQQRDGTGIVIRETRKADIDKYCLTTVQFKIVDLVDVESTTLVTTSPGRNRERLSSPQQEFLYARAQ